MAVAFGLISQAWVSFESIVPMLATSAAFVLGAVLAVVRWGHQLLGLAFGVVLSAVVSCTAFTTLSMDPGLP
jgi:hypothetical protein